MPYSYGMADLLRGRGKVIMATSRRRPRAVVPRYDGWVVVLNG